MIKKFNKIFKKKYNNWDELEKEIIELSTEQERGAAFEDFCYLYFTIKKDLYNVKEIYTYDDMPEEIIKKLDIESKDYGIDGVIVTCSDETISYQAKFRYDRSTPTYRELSTFWAESEKSLYRCIISNCNDLAKVSKKKNNQFLILVDSLLELDKTFFDIMYNICNDEEIVSIPKKKPMEHQKKIILDTLNGFKTYDRGKIIAACGCGKTLTSLWIVEKMKANNVLFVVPSLALIKQTLEQWENQGEEPFEFICVCSDSTVVSNDTFSEKTYELGVPVTTDSENIKNFFAKQSSKRKIVFSTYQSLDAVSIAQDDNFIFDIAIFDEAHKTVGINNSLFALGLKDEYIKIKKRLFMTATEKILRKKANYVNNFNYEYLSMDDELLYGPTFSKLSFGEAISQNIICDYRIILNCFSDSDFKEAVDYNMMGNNNDNILDMDVLYKQLSLIKLINDNVIKKVITFHSNIQNAKNFICGSENVYPFNKLLNLDNSYCSHINGTYNASKRNKIFKNFEKNDISVLSNARCLTEGVDIPLIDAVDFVDYKGSMIDIIQAIGRALRKPYGSDKKLAYIILPVIIPSNVDKIINLDSQFETFHNVLQALRDEDIKINEWIEMVNYKATNKNSKDPFKIDDTKIIINAPGNFDIEDFYSQISYRIAEHNKESYKIEISNIGIEESRKSKYVRIFKTIGDYSVDGLKSQIIIPTLQKYELFAKNTLSKDSIIVNHNNISHCKRLGLIFENGKNYILTNIGLKVLNKELSVDNFLQRQLLLYKENNLFSYRTYFKILLEVEYINKFEFVYCIYTLKDSTIDSIEEAINRINYVRDTYQNINLMSQSNKIKTLDLLNKKYNVSFSYEDVWSSRTTVYNQYNYFKNHIVSLYFDCIEYSIINDSILLSDYSKLKKLIEETDYIESISEEKYLEVYHNIN